MGLNLNTTEISFFQFHTMQPIETVRLSVEKPHVADCPLFYITKHLEWKAWHDAPCPPDDVYDKPYCLYHVQAVVRRPDNKDETKIVGEFRIRNEIGHYAVGSAFGGGVPQENHWVKETIVEEIEYLYEQEYNNKTDFTVEMRALNTS